MMNQRFRAATSVIGRLAVAVSPFIVVLGTVLAQQSGRPPGGPDLKEEQRKREARETMLRKAELGVALAEKDRRRVEAAIEQVKEDYKRIQIVRNELVRILLAGKPLDYKLVADKAGEIHKRADRLKTNLLPPVPEGQDKPPKSQIEFSREEMQDALVRLCNLVANFVDNPALKNPGTTDVEQSTRAGGDLLSIIELSGNVRRSAERLNKPSN